MRNVKRIKQILKEIERLWNEAPNLRFGQLLINLNIIKDDWDTWNLEDDKTLKHLQELKW